MISRNNASTPNTLKTASYVREAGDAPHNAIPSWREQSRDYLTYILRTKDAAASLYHCYCIELCAYISKFSIVTGMYQKYIAFIFYI